MLTNHEIGAYFYDVNAQVEDYSSSVKAMSCLRNPRMALGANSAPEELSARFDLTPDKVMIHSRGSPRGGSQPSSPCSPSS